MYNKQRNFTNPYFNNTTNNTRKTYDQEIVEKFIKPELRKPDDELVEFKVDGTVYLMTEAEYLEYDDYMYKFIDLDYRFLETEH